MYGIVTHCLAISLPERSVRWRLAWLLMKSCISSGSKALKFALSINVFATSVGSVLKLEDTHTISHVQNRFGNERVKQIIA